MSLHKIELPGKRCPDCGEHGGLHFVNALVAQGIGDFSLAGQQLKFSATERVALACERCGARRTGHLENAELSEDGMTFLSGHFVENPQTRNA